MTDKPIRKLYTPTPRFDERPTVPPPFDIEAFVRATAAPDPRPSLMSEPTTQSRPKPAAEGPSSASALLGAIEDSAGPVITQRADDPIAEMRECFSLGDYSGALVIADLVLAADPDDLPVRELRATCRAALEDVYAFLLGPLERIPAVVMLPEHTGNRASDHRTGFLLSLIDGSSTLDAILDVCGLPRLDALRIVHDLVKSGNVGLR